MSVASVTLSGPALMGVSSHLVPHAMMAALPQEVMLGRVRGKAPSPCLDLGYYFDSAKHLTGYAPTNWTAKAAAALARMYLNDREGICVIAGKLHALAIWSANDSDSDGIIQATDQEAHEQYQSICGPGDNGCIIDNVLNVFRTKGLRAGGQLYKIDDYVNLNWTNKQLLWAAIQLFACGTFGINLPEEWTRSAVWKPTNSQIVGGHDVTPCDVGEEGIKVSSWGRIYLMTWEAVMSRQWIEECKIMLSPTWYNKDKVSPSGFNANELSTDLAKLARDIIPETDPPSPLPPPAPPPPNPIPVPPHPTGNVVVLPQSIGKGVYAVQGQAVGRVTFSVPFKAGTYPLTFLRLNDEDPDMATPVYDYVFELAAVKAVLSTSTPLGNRINCGIQIAGFAASKAVPPSATTMTATEADGEAELKKLVSMKAHAGNVDAMQVDWAAILKWLVPLLLQLMA